MNYGEARYEQPGDSLLILLVDCSQLFCLWLCKLVCHLHTGGNELQIDVYYYIIIIITINNSVRHKVTQNCFRHKVTQDCLLVYPLLKA